MWDAMVMGDGIGKQYPFLGEKLATLLALYKYKGFDQALEAPVSRIMVHQPQSKHHLGIKAHP